MHKVSSRWLLVYLVLFGVMGSHGAFAILLTDFPGSPFPGPPITWVWELDLEGDTVALFDPLIIQNDSLEDWSRPGGWTTSQPAGWAFWRNPLNPAENAQGVQQLKWRVVDAAVANAQGGGIFSATPVGAGDDTGTWGIGGTSDGSLIHVPQIPEAGTLSLLAVGLLAGALLKWRKKEME